MNNRKELKIFRKSSIGYLKRMYSISVGSFFERDLWFSYEPETYGQSKVLLRTRNSILRLGGELKIFKVPSIEKLSIVYKRSRSYLWDFITADALVIAGSENYLLRENLNETADYLNDQEWKIFRLPSVDKLNVLYKNKMSSHE